MGSLRSSRLHSYGLCCFGSRFETQVRGEQLPVLIAAFIHQPELQQFLNASQASTEMLASNNTHSAKVCQQPIAAFHSVMSHQNCTHAA